MTVTIRISICSLIEVTNDSDDSHLHLFVDSHAQLRRLLCHMVDDDPDLRNSVKYLGSLPPEILRLKNIQFWRAIGQLRELIANISGTQQDIRKRRCKLRTLPHRLT